MNNIREKFKACRFQFSFSFFILALILAIVFFLLLAGGTQYYRTRISILFIPKSEVLATHMPYVMENLVRLPKTLSFYEHVLRDNSNLTDDFAGKSKDEKKKLWNKSLNIKKDDGSSIINIWVASKDRTQSTELAKQTARALFDTASLYYNIKSDADFRVIDGPIAAPSVKHWIWLLPLSILLGFVASFLLNLISSLLINVAKKLRQCFQSSRHRLEVFEKAKEKRETSSAFPGIKTAIKKSKAPENLPIGEDLSSIPPASDSFEITENAETELPEPTEEELKRRLNQLLKGEL